MKCRICSSNKIDNKYQINKYCFVKCGYCGFEYLLNPPSKRDLLQFYKHKDYSDPLISENRIREDAKRSLSVIDRIINERKTLIDIGCGRGYFLDEARSKGWEVFGLDYSVDVIGYAKRILRLNVNKKNWLTGRTVRKYDLLTMSQFIEHFEDPNIVIKRAYDYISSKGFIYIATPNISSLSAIVLKDKFDHYIPPEHISLFGVKSLSKLLNDNGFKVKYYGTWSYKEELAGIIKKLFKTKKSSLDLPINNSQDVDKITPKSLNYKKKLKYFLFDELFCGHFHSLLDTFNKGSMLEIIAQKNE